MFVAHIVPQSSLLLSTENLHCLAESDPSTSARGSRTVPLHNIAYSCPHALRFSLPRSLRLWRRAGRVGDHMYMQIRITIRVAPCDGLLH